jgi:hypothetical protein
MLEACEGFVSVGPDGLRDVRWMMQMTISQHPGVTGYGKLVAALTGVSTRHDDDTVVRYRRPNADCPGIGGQAAGGGSSFGLMKCWPIIQYRAS